jgi:hypothetical protein
MAINKEKARENFKLIAHFLILISDDKLLLNNNEY